MSPNQTLPRSSRLKRNRDFVRVRRKGKPFRCPYFILFSSPNAKSLPARIGISASRRVGSAVTRNRAKRQYRELFRKIHHQIHPGKVIQSRRSGDAPQCGIHGVLFDLAPLQSLLQAPTDRCDDLRDLVL